MAENNNDELMQRTLLLNQGLRINCELYKHPVAQDALTSILQNRRKTKELIRHQQEQDERLLEILAKE